MEPEERFRQIEALLHDVAQRQKQAELRTEAAEGRITKAEARIERMDLKWDKRFEATRKLVQEGIKFIIRRDQQRDAKFAALVQTVDKLAKTQQAFLDSLRTGGNGNGRKRG